jgi:hypothetical protein
MYMYIYDIDICISKYRPTLIIALCQNKKCTIVIACNDEKGSWPLRSKEHQDKTQSYMSNTVESTLSVRMERFVT